VTGAVTLFDGNILQRAAVSIGGLLLFDVLASFAIRPVARFYGVPFVDRKEARRNWAARGLQQSRLSNFIERGLPLTLFYAAFQQVLLDTPLWAMTSSQLWMALFGVAMFAVLLYALTPWSVRRAMRRAGAPAA
jgi:hypothetical protein